MTTRNFLKVPRIGDEKHQCKWRTSLSQLEVRADNMTALHLILRLKGSTPQLNQIAREVALDLGDAAFRPDIVSHTPGIASTIADDLSRRYCPGTVFKLPSTVGECARSTHQQQRQFMVEIDLNRPRHLGNCGADVVALRTHFLFPDTVSHMCLLLPVGTAGLQGSPETAVFLPRNGDSHPRARVRGDAWLAGDDGVVSLEVRSPETAGSCHWK